MRRLPKAVKERLRIYFDILSGKRLPRFVLASYIEVDDVSWKAHEEASKAFRDELESTQLLPERILYRERPKLSYLDLKYRLAKQMLERCEFCERRCRVNRKKRIGVCRVKDRPAVSSAFLHLGEESPLVPSGTIFFYGCNFRCVFCQNYEISRGRKEIPKGHIISIDELARIADRLAYKGAININRVGGEPTPRIHAIIGAMRKMQTALPQIRNSNMYLTPEALKLIGDLIDLWLPDFKYGNDRCALRLSAALNYRETITRNLLIAKSFGTESVPSEGIVRHLVLPNHIECCTKPVLKRLSDNLSERLVNVMDQYYPTFKVPGNPKYKEIDRRLKYDEYMEAVRYARELGLMLID